jgi:hypothetical protein
MWARRFGCSVLVALLATGCGATEQVGGAAPETNQAAVAWTDEVCGALAGFIEVVTDRPEVDRADPVAAVRNISGYLGSTTEQLQRTLGALDTVGPSPVDGGDEYVSRLKDALGGILAGFDAARTQLATVDTSSRDALAAAVPAAVAPLQRLEGIPDPTEGLGADEELRTAAEQAPNCRRLREFAAPAG